MWDTLLDRVFTGLIVNDNLRVTFPDGKTREYGTNGGARAEMSISDTATMRRLVLNPELALGEAYMDKTLIVAGDDLLGLMKILARNRDAGHLPAWVLLTSRARYHIRRFLQANAPAAARKNVAHHYDISDDLYRLFLDDDMQYSCAYFTHADATLEEAQAAKKAHIANKLRIEPGMRVLDIGCGWGGMALTLARDYGAHVTGVTLSENQLATAKTRAANEGLSDRVQFELRDYRHLNDTFDRIVSVGMFEHVGVPNYLAYFDKVAELLDPDGVALIHTIGRSAPPMSHSPWIHKYIFPGGYVPSLSEIAGPLEQSKLWQADIEVWRLHYAKTLRVWLERFDSNLESIRKMHDDRFVRMFRYYLTVCIVAFEDQMQAVYQLQLAHKRATVPITRDYLYETDAMSPQRSTQTKHAAE